MSSNTTKSATQQNEENVEILRDSFSAVLEPSLFEIDSVMKSVFNSQEELAKQLDTIEFTLLQFAAKNQGQNETPSCKEYIDKILATKELIQRTQQRIAVMAQRTDNIKQAIRDNQQIF
eukprot:UN07282